MATKKRKDAEGTFYDAAFRSVLHQHKLWSSAASTDAACISALSLAVMAVAEQLRLANLMALDERVGGIARVMEQTRQVYEAMQDLGLIDPEEGGDDE